MDKTGENCQNWKMNNLDKIEITNRGDISPSNFVPLGNGDP